MRLESWEDLLRLYYQNTYETIHYSGILGMFTGRYHLALEDGIPEDSVNAQILEIGAGSGEHIPYVLNKPRRYYLLDPYPGEKIMKLAEVDSTFQVLKASAENIPLADSQVDRVIASCVLLHVDDVRQTLEEIRRVSANGALIRIYLPMDPGLIYRAIRHLVSHRKTAKKMRKPMKAVKFIWANEHRNHFLAVKSNIDYIFSEDDVKYKRYPLPFMSWNFNIYAIVTIKVSKKE